MPVFKNIQALRAVGAYLIVLRHLQELLWLRGGESSAFAFGEAGVDLFFVISGFIMVYTTTGKETRPGSFAFHRIVRVVPLYWLITLLVCSLAFIAPWAAGATRSDPGELLKSLLFIPFEKSNGKIRPVVFVGWTLNYEMFFYLLFAVGLFVKRRTAALGGIVLALAALVAGGCFLHPAGAVGNFYTDSILLEFAFGVIIGFFCRELATASRLSPYAFLAILAGGILFILRPYLWPGAPRVLAFGVPSAFIVAAAINLEGNGFVLRNRVVQFLGAAGYSIYLTHFFVTLFFVRLGARLHLKSVAAIAGVMVVALITVGMLGGLTHVFVERRLTRWAKAIFRSDRRERDASGKLLPAETAIL